MTNKAYTVVFGVLGGIVLTAIGVADADGALGLLLTPGRAFNRAVGLDSGPPEAGVVYGLAANWAVLAIVIASVVRAVASVIRRRRVRAGAAT